MQRHVLASVAKISSSIRTFTTCTSIRAAGKAPSTPDSPRNILEARGTIIRQDGDQNTTIEGVVGRIRKSDLCRRYNLQPRDLSALETEILGRRAQIFVRPGSIVYSADVHAVIRSDKLLLLERKDAEEEDGPEKRTALSARVQDEMRKIMLQDRATMTEEYPEATPFEFIALEALLAESARSLFATSNSLQTRYQKLVDDLAANNSIPTSTLQEMLEMKDSTEEFKKKAEDFLAAVTEVLREENDMASMFLTDQANGKIRKLGEDDEIELLLEMYRHHAYSLVDVATTILTRLNSITNHVTLLFSSTRNRLLNMEITIAFANLGTSIGAFIGAMYGMNLKSGLEETPYMFNAMVALSLGLAVLCIQVGRRALLKARSIRGEHQGILGHPSGRLKRVNPPPRARYN